MRINQRIITKLVVLGACVFASGCATFQLRKTLYFPSRESESYTDINETQYLVFRKAPEGSNSNIIVYKSTNSTNQPYAEMVAFQVIDGPPEESLIAKTIDAAKELDPGFTIQSQKLSKTTTLLEYHSPDLQEFGFVRFSRTKEETLVVFYQNRISKNEDDKIENWRQTLRTARLICLWPENVKHLHNKSAHAIPAIAPR